MNTLTEIAQLLHRISDEASRGVAVLYDSEIKLADAENAADKAYALAFINCQGTVEDRKQIATLQSADVRLQAELARAEYNRVKTKLKQLELQQMSVQTQSRLLETELKTLR